MEDTSHRMRMAQRRYYAGNISKIVKHKTLKKVVETGRIPAEETIVQHDIDRDVLREAMLQFAEANPQTKAAHRVRTYLGVWGECV